MVRDCTVGDHTGRDRTECHPTVRLDHFCENDGDVTVHIPPAFEREIKGYGDLAKGGVNYYPSRTGLHWENLDADFTVSGILSGRFGTKAWMVKRQGTWQCQSAW